jgi:hypothetical protein
MQCYIDFFLSNTIIKELEYFLLQFALKIGEISLENPQKQRTLRLKFTYLLNNMQICKINKTVDALTFQLDQYKYKTCFIFCYFVDDK